MALRVAVEVQAELDEIWSYVAAESGDANVAERLINSITDQFLFYPNIRTWVALAITICVRG
jgi:hypothetical protein